MKRPFAVLLPVVVVSVVAAGALWWCLARRSGGQQHRAAPLPEPQLIEVGAPQRRDFSVLLDWFGKTESKERVKVVALEDGRILSVDADDEMPADKGSLLFKLGGDRIDSRLAAARAQVASVQERLALAGETVKRKKGAAEQALVTRDALDAAKASLAQARAELAEATQELQRMEAATRVRAPIAGTFTRRTVSAGQDVAAGDVLAEIIAPDQARIVGRCFLPADARLEGRPANVRVGGGEGLSGIVQKVLPERAASGETIFWIEGQDIARRLRPGEVVSGEIVLAVHVGALAVPSSAIVYGEQETPYVFVREGERYSKRDVATGLVSDGWVEIVSGIAQTESVVIKGTYELYYRDFSKVFKVAD